MKNRLFSAFALSLALALPAAAQTATPEAQTPDPQTSAAELDPTLRETDIVFGGPEPVTIDTLAGAVGFTAEIAATPDQLQRGLMWRETLAPDAAMLFQYQPPRLASIWMENTLISLDILYINSEGRIVKIAANAQPGSRRSLSSDFPIAAVLEIAGGRAEELGIRPGDIVRHDYFGNLDRGAADAEAGEGGAEAEDTTPENGEGDAG